MAKAPERSYKTGFMKSEFLNLLHFKLAVSLSFLYTFSLYKSLNL